MISGRFHPRGVRLGMAIAAAVALAGCGTSGSARARGAAAAEGREHAVVVLSFDGVRSDYLTRDTLPAFERVAAEGVRAASLTPVFPSKTFAVHYTMATGLYPGHHGIVGSRFYDPARGAWFAGASVQDSSWFGGEPIWVTAERQGVRTAVFYWTGSEAAVGGVRPSHYRVFDARVADSTKVDQVAAWLRLPAAERPRLVMAYFPRVDEAGHLSGPDAPETRAALRAADRAVARLLDSLRAMPPSLGVDLVVVSDHGMVPVSRERVVELARLAPLGRLLVANERTVVSLWARDGGAAGRALLDSTYDALRRAVAHARVYRVGELPAAWHAAGNRRLGDLVVAADEGYVLGTDTVPASVRRGEHGYDPALPSMQGIFLARGPHFRRGVRIPALEHVALYPLLAHLLGVRPAAPLDGDLAPVRSALLAAP